MDFEDPSEFPPFPVKIFRGTFLGDITNELFNEATKSEVLRKLRDHKYVACSSFMSRSYKSKDSKTVVEWSIWGTPYA